ncbi:MAG: hypothetical protein WC822_07200, partial [Candidatus Paceibacterota bacterium]
KPKKLEGRDKLFISGKAEVNSDMYELAKKYGRIRRGLSDVTSRPVFAVKGIDEGVITDGFLLIENKESAKKVLSKIVDQIRKENPEDWGKFVKEMKFPDYKALYPKEYTNEWRVVGSHMNELQTADDAARVVLTNGKGDFVTVDADKMAFILDNLKGITSIKSGDVPHYKTGDSHMMSSPIVFFVGNEPKSILMPIYSPLDHIPLALKEAATEINPKEEIVPAIVENKVEDAITPILPKLAKEMGLTKKQITQAEKESVTTIVGLRRIEKNARGEEPKEVELDIDQNAAIHAWYAEHPEKDKFAKRKSKHKARRSTRREISTTVKGMR